MTKNEFDELSQQGYSHIPLVEKIPVDNETPLSTYSKLSNQPFTYLFESVESVVFPVPLNPKNRAVLLLLLSRLAEQCMESTPLNGSM